MDRCSIMLMGGCSMAGGLTAHGKAWLCTVHAEQLRYVAALRDAAPALLAACEALVEYPDIRAAHPALVEQARAAIAKARGGSM